MTRSRSNPFRRLATGSIFWWLFIFALIPNAMVVMVSFMPRGETEFVELGLTLESYGKLLDPLYLQVFWESFWLAALTTFLCLVIGYPFAYIIGRAPRHLRPLLVLLVIIPFWTSSLVRTYAMMILLGTQGVINSALIALGLITEPLELLFTPGAVVAGLVYTLLPFMVLPLYASIEKLDVRLIEAARDLGARKLTTFRKVIIPLTMPGIVAGCMLVFLPGLGMYYVSDILGGAKTTLIGNLIQRQFLSARDWPFGSALSVTLTLTMALMLWAYVAAARRAAQKVEA